MKKVLAILAVVSLLAFPVFASQTVLDSIGGIPASLAGNDQLVLTYPSQIVNFGNKLTLEYDEYTGYSFIQMSGSALGISFRENPGIMNMGTISINAASTVGSYSPSYTYVGDVFDVIYALNLKGIVLSAMLTYGSQLDTNDLKTTGGIDDKDFLGYDATYFSLILGASLDIGMPVDVALSLALPGFLAKDTAYSAAPNPMLTDDDKELLSGMRLGLNVRAIMDAWTFELAGALISSHAENLDWQDSDYNGVPNINTVNIVDDSELSLDLLFSNKIMPSKSLNVILGSGVRMNTTADSKSTVENKVAATKTYGTAADTGLDVYIPVYMIAEYKINDTVTFRGGISKDVLHINTFADKTVLASDGTTIQSNTINTTFTYDQEFDYEIGATITLGDFSIDGWMNLDSLLYGPNFIFGNNTEDMASAIAINYAWK